MSRPDHRERELQRLRREVQELRRSQEVLERAVEELATRLGHATFAA